MVTAVQELNGFHPGFDDWELRNAFEEDPTMYGNLDDACMIVGGDRHQPHTQRGFDVAELRYGFHITTTPDRFGSWKHRETI